MFPDAMVDIAYIWDMYIVKYSYKTNGCKRMMHNQ